MESLWRQSPKGYVSSGKKARAIFSFECGPKCNELEFLRSGGVERVNEHADDFGRAI
jgi:hypothetical protein